MIKLEKETKEKEKLVGNKQKLEKDEADKLEMQKVWKHMLEVLKVQKQQDELKHKKKGRIIESPTQSLLRNSQDYTPEKTNSLDNNELSPSTLKNIDEVRLKKRKKS